MMRYGVVCKFYHRTEPYPQLRDVHNFEMKKVLLLGLLILVVILYDITSGFGVYRDILQSTIVVWSRTFSKHFWTNYVRQIMSFGIQIHLMGIISTICFPLSFVFIFGKCGRIWLL